MFLLQIALFAAFLPYKCYLYVNRMSLQVIVGLTPSPIHCCFKKKLINPGTIGNIE